MGSSQEARWWWLGLGCWGCEKRLDSGQILKVKPRLGMGCERKRTVKEEPEVLDLVIGRVELAFTEMGREVCERCSKE
jgi:hypothetical protein